MVRKTRELLSKHAGEPLTAILRLGEAIVALMGRRCPPSLDRLGACQQARDAGRRRRPVLLRAEARRALPVLEIADERTIWRGGHVRGVHLIRCVGHCDAVVSTRLILED